MANKMISEEDLHDSFLSALIRSEEPMTAPEGFSDAVMKALSLNPLKSGLKPYKPPLWLKWGIPGAGAAGLISLLVAGPAKEAVTHEPVTSLLERTTSAVSTWFSGASLSIPDHSLNVPETALWILGGSALLIWSFLLLSRFLERRDGL
jgi:hypothetical protein